MKLDQAAVYNFTRHVMADIATTFPMGGFI